MSEVTNTSIEPVAPVSGLREFWYYFSRNRGAVLGLIVFTITVLIAIFAPWIAPHPPEMQYKDAFLSPPSWLGGDPRFLLGTDPIGRDILSRLIHGARYSLVIGAVVVLMSLAADVPLAMRRTVSTLWPAATRRSMAAWPSRTGCARRSRPVRSASSFASPKAS